MESLNTNDFELNHIKFLLNFINSNKKTTYSITNYLNNLYTKNSTIKNKKSFELLINEFQEILDDSTLSEELLKSLENRLSSSTTNTNDSLDLSIDLSQTQTTIYESNLKLSIFISRLLEFIDENIEYKTYDYDFQKNTISSITENIEQNNTSPMPLLLISEKTNTVTLPSTGEKIPFSYYKHSSWARFKEAYKLMRNKEKKSLFQSLDLAFELSGRYDLHPAIISACKNIDELDVYLSCLDNNTTKDFPFFEIKFEVSPI